MFNWCEQQLPGFVHGFSIKLHSITHGDVSKLTKQQLDLYNQLLIILISGALCYQHFIIEQETWSQIKQIRHGKSCCSTCYFDITET